MIQTNEYELFTTTKDYLNVVKNWMKRAGVQSGFELGYREDQNPDSALHHKNWFNMGDALVTTGFCVSVSNALLNSEVFQTLLTYRDARAKLISIDIKEQFYGVCKPSYSKNKWHTAIYVEESNGLFFIIDPTCAQFGNPYVGKLIWDFQTWVNTFRSPIDRHELTKFDGTPLSYVNTYHMETGYDKAKKNSVKKYCENFIALTEEEQDMLVEFIQNGFELFNRKVRNGLQPKDLQYQKHIVSILARTYKLNNIYRPLYGAIEFHSKEELRGYVERFMKTKNIPEFLQLTDDLQKLEARFNYNLNKAGSKAAGETHAVDQWNKSYYLLFQFDNCTCIKFDDFRDVLKDGIGGFGIGEIEDKDLIFTISNHPVELREINAVEGTNTIVVNCSGIFNIGGEA